MSSIHGTLAYGGFAIGKLPECIKMSTPDIGCSSTSGGVQLNAGATCFISDGLLIADHGCGEGSIAMENLLDIQVLPGQTAQSLTSCFIFCPIRCFNKQSFFINLLARRK
jgi:hypothetical protein